MNNIKNIFTPESVYKFSKYFENPTLCYYPSSAFDFKPIFYWNHYCSKKDIFPTIFLYSDFTLFDKKGNHNTEKSKTLNDILKYFDTSLMPSIIDTEIIDEFHNNKLEVIDWCELLLNDDIIFRNNSNINFPDMIFKNEGKIIALACKLTSKIKNNTPLLKKGDLLTGINGKKYSLFKEFPISVLIKNLENNTGDYFDKNFFEEYQTTFSETQTDFLIILSSIENSNFFYDIILKNELKLKYLTHIMDGGQSKGMSNLKMDYMYLYIKECGLNHVLVDQDIETKIYNCKQWLSYKHINPKNENEFIKPTLPYDICIENKEIVYFPESRNIGECHTDWDYSDFDIKRTDFYASNWSLFEKFSGRFDGQRERYILKYNHYKIKPF